MEEGKLQVQPNIKKFKLEDGIERYYIDTFEKLYWIVNERFKLQKKNKREHDEPVINLSNLIIIFQKGYRYFWIGYLVGKIDGIINIGNKKEFDPTSNDGIPFNQEVQFEVKYQVNFKDSIIYNMAFGNTSFLKTVSFMNVHFIAGANLEGAIFESYVDFMHINIEQMVNHYNLPNISGAIMFHNITFKDQVSLAAENWTNCNNFHFNNNIFDKDVDFTLCCIDNDMPFFYDFSNSIFNGNVFFDGRSRPDVKPKIISKIDFNNSHFNKKLKMWNVKLGSISMQNCRFNDSVSITHNYYDNNSELDFTFSTINSLFFIDSDLGSSKGETIKLSNEISFSKSLITKDAFIFFRNINNGPEYSQQGVLNFEYANILGTITVQDSKLKVIKLAKSTLIGDINIEKVDTEYDCRESIAKVKDSFLKRNDVVNSLAYKAKEMKYYSKHLNFKSPYLNKIVGRSTEKSEDKREKDTLEEYVLLNLNRISNSFGMSWVRGVLFTCITALFFFILINYLGMPNPFFENIPTGENCFGYLWKNYLYMFSLLDFKDKFSEGIELNALGDTLFFVSKIFVSYGIYQTISAFRKYGK